MIWAFPKYCAKWNGTQRQALQIKKKKKLVWAFSWWLNMKCTNKQKKERKGGWPKMQSFMCSKHHKIGVFKHMMQRYFNIYHVHSPNTVHLMKYVVCQWQRFAWTAYIGRSTLQTIWFVVCLTKQHTAFHTVLRHTCNDVHTDTHTLEYTQNAAYVCIMNHHTAFCTVSGMTYM